jgi:ABC-type uncharacterized transport system involved in gliding motility auxiliary subunit
MDWLNKMSRRRLTIIAVLLAAITLMSVNMFAGTVMRSWRADLTEGKLFTITDATRQVLGQLDEAINVRLYYSRALGDQAPHYAAHAERARGLLELYADLAGGKLNVEVIDPEPFSDEEDRAVAAGLRGVPIGQSGQAAYLGVAGSNSTDDQETIGFLSLERQNFLEYDLTKLIHKLADPARKTIGLITRLGLAGGVDPQRGRLPQWMIYQQMSELFDIEVVNATAGVIPPSVDVLLLVAPDPLSEREVYAIDQFALSGKPVIAFVDPFSETHPQQVAHLKEGQPIHDLLAKWGAQIEPEKIVGDINHARQVQFNANGNAQVASYVPWLNLNRAALDQGNALFSSIEQLVMASAGSISPVKEAGTSFAPLILTSPEAMLIDAIEMRIPDPLRLLNAYKPGGQSLVLAARLSGEAKTAFGDGAPKAEDEAEDKKPPAHLSEGKIDIVLVGDADMLFDSFWAQAQEILGQRFIVPRAHNADFLMNALENVTGGAVLAGLRGRGVATRPFTVVQDIRREAESKFRQREQELNKKLEETQKKLAEIQSRAEGGNVILSDEDKRAILDFRSEVVTIRKDLREVQRALRADIENLGFWVKAANIAGVPALIGLVAGGVALRRRRRR